MDPDATLAEIARHLDAGNRAEALRFVGYLQDWIRSGGYRPEWSSHPEAAEFYRHHTDGGPVLPDQEFLSAAEAAGLDPVEAFRQPEPEAAGYNVSILYAGTFDAEAVVYLSYNDAADVARELVSAERDPELRVLVTHTAVGPDYMEATGYGPYGAFTWDPDAGAVTER